MAKKAQLFSKNFSLIKGSSLFAEFKTKIVLEALREQDTAVEIAAKYEIHAD